MTKEKKEKYRRVSCFVESVTCGGYATIRVPVPHKDCYPGDYIDVIVVEEIKK